MMTYVSSKVIVTATATLILTEEVKYKLNGKNNSNRKFTSNNKSTSNSNRKFISNSESNSFSTEISKGTANLTVTVKLTTILTVTATVTDIYK